MAAPLAAGAVLPAAWAGMCILTVLLLAAWAVRQAAQGKVRLVWSPLFLPGLALLALAGAQWRLGLTADPMGTREAVIKLCSGLLIFFLALQFLAEAGGRVWRRVTCAVTAYAFAVALVAIIQFFSSPGLLYGLIRPRWGGYIFGTYVSHNNYAGLMEMLIPLALGLALSLRPRHPARPVVLFAVLLCLVSVLLSGSRGGVLALLAEFVLLAAIVLLAQPASQARHRALMAGLALAVMAGASFFWLDPGGVWKRWERLADSAQLSSNDRRRMAADTLRIARDHLAAGVGIGAFAAAYPAYQTVITDDVIDYAHNDYAQLLAEGGAPAGAVLLGSLAAFFWLAFRRLRSRLQHSRGWLQLGAAIGVCGILVHSFLDFNLHIPANAAWFAFCGALATLSPDWGEASSGKAC